MPRRCAQAGGAKVDIPGALTDMEHNPSLAALNRRIAEQNRTIAALEYRLHIQDLPRSPDSRQTLDLLGSARMSDGRWREVSPALCRALGWQECELLGMTVHELLDPNELLNLDARLAAGKPIAGLELNVRCRTGRKRISWNIVPHPAADLVHYSGRDVTEARLADELLEAQNQALEAVAAPTTTLHAALTALTDIVDDHSRHASIASIMLVEGARLRACVGPGLPAAYHEALDGVAITNGLGTCATAAAVNEVVYTPDIAAAPSWQGLAHLPLELGLKAAWSMPIRGTGGEVLGTFGTYFREPRLPSKWEQQLVEGLCQSAAWAIERHRAEESLAVSEERLRCATEAADIGTWRVDLRTGRYSRDANLDRILGIAPAGQAEQTASEVILRIHPDDRARVRQASQAVLDGAERYDERYRIICADGAERWIHSRGRVFHGPNGERLFLTGVGVDVTDRLRTEQRLREEEARKDEFLAVLGHELRNPLAPLRIGLELLDRGVPAEQHATLCAMMARQVKQLNRLADDLLDVSRISQGKLALEQVRVDLDDVLIEAIELSKPFIDERSHELVIDKAAAPLPVDGDSGRLIQVVGNLLRNAARYMDREGTIRVTTRVDDGMAVLRVRDTGYGIPPEALDGLFEMFHQVTAHREMTGGGGLGVGLALSRRLLALQGGTIEATSRGAGQGAEFVVRLPLGQSMEADAPLLVGPTGDGPSAAAICAGRRVLVVDDDPDLAASLCLAMSLIGVVAESAPDGVSALEAIEHFALKSFSSTSVCQ